MKNCIHIFANEPAVATMRQYLKENINSSMKGKAKFFQDDLSIGPLSESLEQRMQWLHNERKKFGINEPFHRFYKQYFDNFIINGNEYSDSRTVFWHGPNVIDQCAFRYFVNQCSCLDVFEMNLAEVFPKYRSTAELMKEDIAVCESAIRSISSDRKKELTAQWLDIEKKNGFLRIWKNEYIETVEANYYDGMIKMIAKQEHNVQRIVGHVMGETDQVVGDFYLLNRVRYLKELGEL